MVVHYYEHIEGQIKQVKKNSDAKRRTVIQLGYNQSQLSNYEMNTLSNRNSVYYALGQRLLWKENLSFRTSFFLPKMVGIPFITYLKVAKRLLSITPWALITISRKTPA